MYKTSCAFIYTIYVYRVKKFLYTLSHKTKRFYKNDYWWLKPMKCILWYG